MITKSPNNKLAVRCRDDHVYMTCVSDGDDEIGWLYHGNTIINSPCTANTNVFVAERKSKNECNIRALLANATRDPNIRILSGPYACTDRSSDGVFETAMVIVLGKLLFLFLRNCLWITSS